MQSDQIGQATGRWLAPDLLRAVAAAAVVGIHAGGETGVLRQAMDLAVPVFLILQGHFLAQRCWQARDPAGELARWWSGLAGLYLIWSLPLLYLQRGQGAAALLWSVLGHGLGVLWYLHAVLMVGAGLWVALKWKVVAARPSGTRPSPAGAAKWRAAAIGTLFVAGWGLTLGGDLAAEGLQHTPAAGFSWAGELWAVEPMAAPGWRNALTLALPLMALGALAGTLRPNLPSAGRVSLACLVAGVGLLWAEDAAVRFLWGGAAQRRTIHLGQPLAAFGLIGLALSRPWRWPRSPRLGMWTYWPLVTYVGHIPLLAVVWRLGPPDGPWLWLVLLLGCTVLLPLVHRLAHRWPLLLGRWPLVPAQAARTTRGSSGSV